MPSTTANTPIAHPDDFQGRLEGLGNRITGLRIDAAGSTQDTGFLQEVDTGGVVANLTLGGTYKIHGKSGGGVVADNSGTLVQVVFDGTIDVPSGNGNYCETYMDIGGIAGTSSGTVSFSHATGSITGQCVEVAGGLLGRNNGSVDHSWAGVTLTATQNVCCNVEGGLIGIDRESGTIDWTFATGSIADSRGDALGGLIGAMSGSALSNSSASGAVTGDCCEIGGLVGEFYTESGYPVASIDTSVATGAVTGNANCWCGGAIGDAYDETGLDRISNTTSYGTVTGGTRIPAIKAVSWASMTRRRHVQRRLVHDLQWNHQSKPGRGEHPQRPRHHTVYLLNPQFGALKRRRFEPICQNRFGVNGRRRCCISKREHLVRMRSGGGGGVLPK